MALQKAEHTNAELRQHNQTVLQEQYSTQVNDYLWFVPKTRVKMPFVKKTPQENHYAVPLEAMRNLQPDFTIWQANIQQLIKDLKEKQNTKYIGTQQPLQKEVLDFLKTEQLAPSAPTAEKDSIATKIVKHFRLQ